MTVRDRIANASDTLTPTERRIAEAVSRDPTILAFGTVSDLADRADTSRPSVVRFATKLGFAGYPDLQRWARAEVSEQLAASPSARVRRAAAAEQTRADIAAAVEHAFNALVPERLAAIARPIATARRVWVLSGETSQAGARVLQSGLSMARPDVHLVQEHSVGRDLSNAGPGDAAVVFDFARYRRSAVTAARTLADLGVTLAAVTDTPLSPLAALTQRWCELRIPPVGPFDSAVPAVVAAELITAQVVRELGDDARHHIDKLESIWLAAGTFIDDDRPNP